MLNLQPLTIAEARVFIERHHRHHPAPVGAKFAIGLTDGSQVVGVITVGRPVARGLDDGWTAEVTRCAVLENIPNGCSKLYAAAWRAARAMGYRKLITYTLDTEPGTSLRAAGWQCVGVAQGGSWSTPTRPRVDKHPLQAKLRWEVD